MERVGGWVGSGGVEVECPLLGLGETPLVGVRIMMLPVLSGSAVLPVQS